MKQILSIFSLFSTTVVVLIFLFLSYFSAPLIKSNLSLFSLNWSPPNSYGLMPMLLSTLLIATLATTFAYINALSVALFLNRLKRGKLKLILQTLFNILGSIPTVVYGFLGVILLVPFIRELSYSSGYNIISAAITLSFLITPTIVLFLIDSFDKTKNEYKLIVCAIGGNTIDYQLKVLLKVNKKALIVAAIMGFSRAIGDTMIALMVAGNSIKIPDSLSSSVRTLTSHIALTYGGDFDSIEFKTIFASGLILFFISLNILIAIKAVGKKNEQSI